MICEESVPENMAAYSLLVCNTIFLAWKRSMTDRHSRIKREQSKSRKYCLVIANLLNLFGMHFICFLHFRD